MTHDSAALFDAVDATWPPAGQRREGPWAIRDGQGGGKRVSAASALSAVTSSDISLAETAMRSLNQDPLFMIRGEDAGLDQMLAAQGYGIVDPVRVLVTPVRTLTDRPVPRVTAFSIWEPLAIMAEIWAAGGIGPARLNVMDRAAVKTGIFLRWNEKPAGVGFVACHGDIAMVHAVEVLEAQRRQGVAGWIMRAAAFWAARQGATTLSVLCTEANTGANALYSALGFEAAGHYHYRIKSPTGAGHYG